MSLYIYTLLFGMWTPTYICDPHDKTDHCDNQLKLSKRALSQCSAEYIFYLPQVKLKDHYLLELYDGLSKEGILIVMSCCLKLKLSIQPRLGGSFLTSELRLAIMQ